MHIYIYIYINKEDIHHYPIQTQHQHIIAYLVVHTNTTTKAGIDNDSNKGE